MHPRIFLYLFPLLFCGMLHAQSIHPSGLTPPEAQGIRKQALFSDERVSSTLLWISDEVKLHKHASHSEHVVVLSGKGEMRLGEETFTVRKGDVIFIPQGTPHSVKVSKGVLKVISVQAPQFDGTDRILLE